MSEVSNADQMLSANQAGKMLGVSGKTIIRMMEAGDFVGYRIGNAWKFKRGNIEAYLESRKFQGVTKSPEVNNNGKEEKQN